MGKSGYTPFAKNTIIVKLCKKSKTFSVFMRMRPHSNRIIHAKRVGLGSLVRPRSNRQLTYKRADYRKASKPPKGEQAAQKRSEPSKRVAAAWLHRHIAVRLNSCAAGQTTSDEPPRTHRQKFIESYSLIVHCQKPPGQRICRWILHSFSQPQI